MTDRESLAVETRSLQRTFKGGIEAVRGIDLAVSEGEVFGFLGPNGAGKTTTVRMLCTLLPPTSGTAVVAGVDVVADSAEVRRRIGVALQEMGSTRCRRDASCWSCSAACTGSGGRRRARGPRSCSSSSA